MAYLKKRGKNSWRITLSLGIDNNGKRIRKRITIKAKNKTEAKRKATIIEAKYLKKDIAVDINYTFKEYLIIWLQNHKNNLKRTTFAGYEMKVQKHIIPALGEIKLKGLNKHHIKNYYKNKRRNGRINGSGGLSSTTVHNHHVLIKHALKDAVNEGLIDNNPAELVEAPKKKKYHDYNILNPKQIKNLLEKAKKLYPTNYELIYFTLYTGLRRGEVLGLRWKDVNFKKKNISIKNTLLRNPDGGNPIQTYPKSKSSFRTIPLTDNTLKILKNKKNIHSRKNILNPKQLVFCDINGEPLRPSTFSKRFSRLVKKCNLDIRFHDLRHTHATILFKQGIHPKVVQSRLGHSNISTTLDTYTHDDSEIQIKAIKKIENSDYNVSLDD